MKIRQLRGAPPRVRAPNRRWRALLLAAVTSYAAFAASACSSADCKPPLPAGVKFKVTVVQETANSTANCHVIDVMKMSPFEMTTAPEQASAAHPACTYTPGAAPPAQQMVTLENCVADDSAMLGVYCTLIYPSMCQGYMYFYFMDPPGAKLDWTASTINGALFRVEDNPKNCLGLGEDSSCKDEFEVNLTREN